MCCKLSGIINLHSQSYIVWMLIWFPIMVWFILSASLSKGLQNSISKWRQFLISNFASNILINIFTREVSKLISGNPYTLVLASSSYLKICRWHAIFLLLQDWSLISALYSERILRFLLASGYIILIDSVLVSPIYFVLFVSHFLHILYDWMFFFLCGGLVNIRLNFMFSVSCSQVKYHFQKI